MMSQDDNKHEKRRRQLKGNMCSVLTFVVVCLVVAALGRTVAHPVEAGHPAAVAIQRHLGSIKKAARRHLDKWKAPQKSKLSRLRGGISDGHIPMHRRDMQNAKAGTLDGHLYHKQH